jgi:hypothetical protein
LDTFGGEIDFRARLETEICSGSYKQIDDSIAANRDELKIPLVLVVFDGGPNTVNTVYKSILQKTPCLFVHVNDRSYCII